MSSRSLNSDHVNYLIWRYLQESGYGDAAVKLQRDWKLEPQRLPFAPHIKTHALVSLVQKGLQYHEVEHSLDQRGHPVPPTDGFYFFGSASQAQSPPPPLTQSPRNGDASPAAVAAAAAAAAATALSTGPTGPGGPATEGPGRGGRASSPRKHPRDSVVISAPNQVPLQAQGQSLTVPAEATNTYGQHQLLADAPPHLPPPAAKRSRKSSDYENNHHGADAMDLDPPAEKVSSNGMAMLHRQTLSPIPIASPHQNGESADEDRATARQGISVAVQVDKVGDVGAETARILDVGKASVLHANWHPHDPTLLLTAGTDALSRIWKISRNASSREINGHGHGHGHSDQENGHLEQTPSVELNIDGSESTYITALQWNPDGDLIAVAPREFGQQGNGTVAILSKANGYLDVFHVGRDPLVCLRWSPRGALLLGVASSIESQNSEIFVWNVASGSQLEVLAVDGIVIDAAWVSDEAFAICVGPSINQFRITNQRAIPFASATNPCGTSEGDSFQVMRWDKYSRTIALGSQNGDVHIFRGQNFIHRFSVKSSVTNLAWHTHLASSQPHDDIRRLAIGTESGTVRIVNGVAPFQTIFSLLPPSDIPVQALNFTPDGYALGAKAGEKVFVWDVEHGGAPRAIWQGPETKPTKLEDSDSDGDWNEHVILEWDADGRRLVVAEGRSVAVVQFGRTHTPLRDFS